MEFPVCKVRVVVFLDTPLGQLKPSTGCAHMAEDMPKGLYQ